MVSNNNKGIRIQDEEFRNKNDDWMTQNKELQIIRYCTLENFDPNDSPYKYVLVDDMYVRCYLVVFTSRITLYFNSVCVVGGETCLSFGH